MNNIPQNIQQIVQEFISGTQQILGNRIKRIILYGSYARGDYKSGSDIDIMILTDLNDDEIIKYRTQIWDYAYDLEYENDFDIELSPLLKNVDDFNKYTDSVPFCMNIKREGVDLV